jgi:RNA polymerase sigma factor (sigma-70 family)
VQYSNNRAPERQKQDLSNWELNLSQYVVRDFLDERGQIAGMDEDDLTQEVLTDWITKKERYKNTAGASIQTFFRTVAKNRLEDIYRRVNAIKRGSNRLTLSLERPISDEKDSDLLSDTISDTSDLMEKIEDVDQHSRTLRLLKPRQRKLVEGIEEGYKLAEMARKMKVPRTTLNDELDRIKRILRKHGYNTKAKGGRQ